MPILFAGVSSDCNSCNTVGCDFSDQTAMVALSVYTSSCASCAGPSSLRPRQQNSPQRLQWRFLRGAVRLPAEVVPVAAVLPAAVPPAAQSFAHLAREDQGTGLYKRTDTGRVILYACLKRCPHVVQVPRPKILRCGYPLLASPTLPACVSKALSRWILTESRAPPTAVS